MQPIGVTPARRFGVSAGQAGEAAIKEYLLAAALAKLEMVYYFVEIERVPVDASLNGKPSALGYAAMTGNAPLVAYLLAHGAAVDRADGAGQTALHYAVLTGGLAVIATLVGHGAALNPVNAAGQTPLALAARSDKLNDCCQLLRGYGAGDRSGPAGCRRLH